MSDFINRLLQRNFGNEAPGEVQPRLPALFETADGLVAVQPIAETPVGPVATTASPLAPAGAVRSTSLPPPQAAGDDHPTGAALPTPASQFIRSARRVEADQAEVRSLAQPVLAPASPGRPLEPLERSSEPMQPAGSIEQAARIEPLEPSPPTGPLQPARQERISPVIMRTERPEQPISAPILPAPQAGRETSAPDEPQREPPVIHITIGRIELVAPPTQPMPGPPAARRVLLPARPVRSLDDYLNRRNEGKK